MTEYRPATGVEIVARAHEAIEEIDKRHFDAWIDIAEAFAFGSGYAMHEAKVNERKGGHYNKAYGDWLAANKLDDQSTKFDKATRSYLLKLHDNLNEIVEWRKLQSRNKQRALNHPATVYKGWLKRDEGIR